MLAGLAAASVQGRVATGPRLGARLRRVGDPPETMPARETGACQARSQGAGLVVPAGQRETLERVCRYLLRPPVPADRLRVAADGQVWLQLRHRWADGTPHFVFDPVEFLGRLAVLVPGPRVNLLLSHGVLGPRAAWRSAVVPGRATNPAPDGGGDLEARTSPVVSIVARDAAASEARSDSGTFRISRTGSLVGALTVNYSIAGGQGQATSADYGPALTNVVTIPASQSFVDLVITPVDDSQFEGTETLTLTVFDTGSYDVGSPATASLTITDNDPPESAIESTRSGLVYDRRTQKFSQQITLRNTSQVAIAGPIVVALDGLSPNATLSNLTGLTTTNPPLGSPFIQVIGPGAPLAPGGSVTVVLQFANPSMGAINYTLRVLVISGPVTPWTVRTSTDACAAGHNPRGHISSTGRGV
ncbi:unannotated protein [freshwater metagenome]|uniref:Unannotated protein n=1 Tax=freshwater metagenome TaxID=449393 RepID=A0A6J7I5I0_9ZZZZ